MNTKITYKYFAIAFLLAILVSSCVPGLELKTEDRSVPTKYFNETDSTNIVDIEWRAFFADSNLIALIDTALKNNQELNITLQEINVSKNEIKEKKGEYLPFVNLGASAEVEKVGEFTRNGVVEKNLDIKPDIEFPEPLSDLQFGAYATWEIDVWKKLHNAKEAAVYRYLSSIEGMNFMVTNLIAEIADSYYELLALDNLLEIINTNVTIQTNALNVVKQQKNAARVTQLAVNRFSSQLLNTQNLQYEIKQRITQTENRINFLTGRFPEDIPRSSATLLDVKVDSIAAGIPSQLLTNRPDIRQAEMELAAAQLDILAARANFFPTLDITAGIGFQAYTPNLLVSPESMAYGLAGDIIAPLINRNAIKAAYSTAGARQIQAAFDYEQTILNAHVDVLNQLAKLDNFTRSYETKSNEVDLLTESVVIANRLFNSARADYAEVLLTQEEALDSKMELVEIKLKQLNAKVNIYRALGGGWKK